jgi:homopolymeric O-antigen transport system permease protein
MVNYPTATGDLTGGFRRFDIWLGLAWLDLKLRYRRTLVGPFWLPLSSVVTIAVMGFIYGKLFKMNLAEYFPYLACGLALWSLIASFIADAHSVFVSAAPIAHQTPLPYSLYVLRRVANGFIQFIHTSVSFWAVAICFGVPFGIHTLMAVPALAMLAWFGFWITLGLGTVCLRFRDLAQIIIVGTQLLFLATPIFWKIDLLADQRWLATCNPCFHLLEICRAPLLGQPIPWNSWIAALVINAVGSLLAFAVFARCRNRLAYWM